MSDHLNKRTPTVRAMISRFAKDDSGATAIEYGLIAGLIAVVIVTAVSTIGTDLRNILGTVGNKL
jgi:pilus assembly protein Flp/PilA